MRAKIVIRRLLIILLALLLVLNVIRGLYITLHKLFFEDKGDVKIYLNKDDTPETLLAKYYKLNHKTAVVAVDEIKSKEIAYYYPENQVQSRVFTQIEQKLQNYNYPVKVIKNNGTDCTFKIDKKFYNKKEAEKYISVLKYTFGLQFHIGIKYKEVSKKKVHLLIEHIPQSDAYNIASKMKDNEVRWLPTN